MFGLQKKKNDESPKVDRIYLDYASATPLRSEVLAAMLPYLTESFGNPGSIHAEGQIAKAVVTKARAAVAKRLLVQPESVTFTSGGTESNNLGIVGVVFAQHHAGVPYSEIEIITTNIEHPATSKTFAYLSSLGVVVKYMPVNGGGEIILSELTALLSPQTLLVSIAYVNSEIGVVQDIGAVSRLLAKFSKQHDCSIYLHVDAAQAPWWLSCEFPRLGCDLMSLDAGKFSGPKGVGVLAHLKRVPLVNISFGGGQERGLRPGTESVASIVGFTTAFTLAQNHWTENAEKVGAMQAYFFKELADKIPTAVINGVVGAARVVNNINISIPGIDSEFAVVTLDVAGIAISTKSACSSAGGGESLVVKTITGDSARASTTLRFTLGLNTTKAEIDRALNVLAEHVTSLSKSGVRPLTYKSGKGV